MQENILQHAEFSYAWKILADKFAEVIYTKAYVQTYFSKLFIYLLIQ